MRVSLGRRAATVVVSIAGAGLALAALRGLPACSQRQPPPAPRQEPVASAAFALGANTSVAKGLGVTIGQEQDGLYWAFAVNTNNAPIAQKQTGQPASWGNGWSTLSSGAPAITSHLAVGLNSNGTLEVFARGSNNLVYHTVQTAQNSTSWTTWAALSNALAVASDPSVTIDGNSDLNVFALGWNDDHVWTTKQTSGSWSGSSWSTVNNGLAIRSNVAATVNTQGLIHLVGRGTDSNFYYIWQPSVGSWTNSTWTALPSTGSSTMLWDPVVCNEGPQFSYVDIYGVATDQTARHTWVSTSSTMGSWDNLGGPLMTNLGCNRACYFNLSPSSATTDGSGPEAACAGENVFLFGLNASTQNLYEDKRIRGVWSGWSTVTSGFTYTSAAVPEIDPAGNFEVFLRGSANNAEEAYTTNGSSWNSTPASLGSNVVISPPENPLSPIPSVTTQHNDNGRGGNVQETLLTNLNVNQYQFGRLFTVTLDGNVYAQPLYVPNVTIGGSAHNVVYVATTHNSVYAIDADTGSVLWQSCSTASSCSNAIFGPSVPMPNTNFDGCGQNLTEIGIVGTPVIDTSTGTLYVVAFSANFTPGTCAPSLCQCPTDMSLSYAHKLYALDITTGTGKTSINGGNPATICSATVNGCALSPANGFNGGYVTPPAFIPQQQMQRPGLLLQSGIVYIGFGSIADFTGNGGTLPYFGWVLGYNASSLALSYGYIPSPTDVNSGRNGGIWQSGQGLMGDGNSVYLMTGNGKLQPDANFTHVNVRPLTMTSQGRNTSYLGDAFAKLNSGLSVVDWFAPYNSTQLNGGDFDLGSSGPMHVPQTNLLIGAGKKGYMYVVNTAPGFCSTYPSTFCSSSCACGMGGQDVNDDNEIWQAPFSVSTDEVHAAPAYWLSPGPSYLYVYVWGRNNALNQFLFTGSTFNTSSVASSPETSKPQGGAVAVSAWTYGGSNPIAGTGIVWASRATSDVGGGIGSGELHAFEGGNVANELWNSLQNATRDDLGDQAKFVAPTVANGKVYLPSDGPVDAGVPDGQAGNGQLNVYGLLQ